MKHYYTFLQLMIFVGYFLYKVFESIPPSARGKYLFLKKTFSSQRGSRDEEYRGSSKKCFRK